MATVEQELAVQRGGRAEPRLGRQLRGLRRRMLAIRTAAGLLFGIPAAAAVVALWIWLDLLWELSPAMRIAGDALAILAAAVALAIVVGRAARAANRSAIARTLDRVGDTGGQILSGFDLAYGSGSVGRSIPGSRRESPEGLEDGLARLAVDRAGKLAGGVAASRAVPLRPLSVAAGCALGTIALVGISAIAMPRLVAAEWLRLVDPLGDHPPFSRVQLSIEPQNANVVYGGSLDVFATAAGTPVERVDLVLVDPASGTEEALPMFPEAADRWRTVLSRVTLPREYFVRSGRARSRRYSLAVITTPRIEEVRCRVMPPSYTHLPPYEGPIPSGGLSGLPGTNVQIWATSNRPLREGAVRIVPSGGRPRDVRLLAAVAPEEVAGSFAITAAGKFELQVTDTDGTPSEEPMAGVIHLLHDDRPFVRIRQPAAVSLATPDALLPVVVSAEDDYGISRVQLYRSLNSSPATPVDFPLASIPPTRSDPQDRLPLASFGLAPGDAIRLFARVEDNDPAGAKGSESPAVEIRIISQQEFERMLRAREGLEVLASKYRQARRRMESLAKDADGLRKKAKSAGDKKLSSAERAQLRSLAQRLQEAADQLDAAAKHLLPYDIDHALSQHLQRLARKMHRHAADLDQLASQSNLTGAELEQSLDDLQHALDGEEADFDHEALARIENIELLYPLIEDGAKFVELARQQKDLAERLASLKGRDGEDSPLLKGRMRDLELQQKDIREALAKLLDDIETHAAKLPDDKQFAELRAAIGAFVAQVRSSGASDAMTEAEAGLAEFSGTRGHAGAQKAADILDKFLSKMQSVSVKAKAALALMPGLTDLLGNTIEQLLGEAGLSPGEGSGASGSGGMSYRRSTLDNVGLYGQMAGMDPTMSGGQDRDRNVAGDATGSIDANRSPDSAAAEAALQASGSGAAPVPPGYRIRVGAYFQRIIDDRDQPVQEKSR
ncbi:MAG TPA: hypothetical protein VHX65_09840 [Pirellulales bacterium]|nr:hypothetical protein [Pirellulales bacterium]